jgi:hypothetical protein
VLRHVIGSDKGNVAKRYFAKIGGVDFTTRFVDLRREDAIPAEFVKRQAHTADTGEKVYEGKKVSGHKDARMRNRSDNEEGGEG